jgi:hypothetical protein
MCAIGTWCAEIEEIAGVYRGSGLRIAALDLEAGLQGYGES